ncbi:hypothetical protein [Methanolobus bombayensis]|uniref:hypothetical protein n=1 Tax=Methanolobus bombayensis TaxID=38023 RepID=UPI001AE57A51|nr:hypothetical protein [Methanolobus bombayensis]MBP1908649.1 hypothetical protein [Methanolobus bombayensis]
MKVWNQADMPKKDISELIRTGDKMVELLEEMSANNEKEYQKNRNIFISEYSKWYTKCLPLIRSMVPDKATRFESLYHTNKRTGMNEYTYTVQDYIHGIYFKDKPKSYTDAIISKRIKEQRDILQASVARTSDFSFEMERFVKINPLQGLDSSAIVKQNKLIDINFFDEHYNSIRAEINTCFKQGFYMASFLLSKELIQNLLVDLIRTNFPLAGEGHRSLYYNYLNERFRGTGELLKAISEKKQDFDINPEAIDYLIELVSSMEPKLKPEGHSFGMIPKKEEIQELRIEETMDLIIEIINFIKK